jgi:MFS family permease
VSLAITSMSLPFFFYAQGVRGWSPTESALLMAPMAVVLMALSPFVGKLVDRTHPRNITIVGFGTAAIAMFWLSQLIAPDTEVWLLCLPMALFGVSNACLWAPLSATATRNLPMASAGSGAGVYNTTRQIGAVLGSAAIAALIQARLTANGLEGATEAGQGATGAMPAPVQTAFSDAMSQTLYLPVVAFVIGVVLVLFLARPSHAGHGGARAAAAPESVPAS